MEMLRRKQGAGVADSKSWLIDKVDGVPSTHRQRGWVHAWTIAEGRMAPQPLPVDAKHISPALAVSIMTLVVALLAGISILAVLGASS